MPNYIEEIAQKIREIADPGSEHGTNYDPLYRMYAVLMMAKGEETTSKDVHDAWSAWAIQYSPNNKFIIPFDQLPKFIQEFDDPFTHAIHEVARHYKARSHKRHDYSSL